jgi:type II secretory pathway pseudopilin PulG
MKYRNASAFSLVEVTLAIGVAAFCLLAVVGLLPVGLKTNQAANRQTIANGIVTQIIGDLRSASRRIPSPSDNSSVEFTLCVPPGCSTPGWVFFSDEGTQTGLTSLGTTAPAAPAGSVYRTHVTYYSTASTTSSLVHIEVFWPAAPTDLSMVTGSVETFVIIDRPAPAPRPPGQ